MLNLDQFMNIRFLHRQGHSVRAIARLTGHSRNTVRRLLRVTRAPIPAPRVRASMLDPYKPYLIERWKAHGLSAVRLHPEIQAQGFGGSLELVRRVTSHATVEVVLKHYFKPGREDFRRALTEKMPAMFSLKEEATLPATAEKLTEWVLTELGSMTPDNWSRVRDQLVARLRSAGTGLAPETGWDGGSQGGAQSGATSKTVPLCPEPFTANPIFALPKTETPSQP
jgi:hypothetical protein